MSPESSPLRRHDYRTCRRLLLPAVALCLGLLGSGCGGSGQSQPTARALLERNAHLQNQVTAGEHAKTALAVVLILISCGLAASLHKNIQGGKGGCNGQAGQHLRSRR